MKHLIAPNHDLESLAIAESLMNTAKANLEASPGGGGCRGEDFTDPRNLSLYSGHYKNFVFFSRGVSGKSIDLKFEVANISAKLFDRING